MIADMKKKELLTRSAIMTGLGIITIGAVVLSSTNILITQVLGQELAAGSNISAATIDAAGSPLYNLTINDKSYPIKFNITGGILDTMAIDGDQALLLVNQCIHK